MPLTLGQMGNSIQVSDIITKKALALLKNNLVAAPLVYQDHTADFTKMNGDTITVKKPFRAKTASGRTLVRQPMVDQTTTFTAQYREHFAVSVTDEDLTLTLDQYAERYLNSGMVQLANVIDKSIIDSLKVGAFFSAGTPASAVTVDTFHDAKANMNDVAIPDDGLRSVMLNSIDAAAVSKSIYGKYQEGMVKQAIQKGYMGPIAGFNLYESANLTTHTVGALGGTPLANSATAQTGTAIITDGWSNSTAVLNAGDVITFDGVYEINPQNYTSTGRLAQFVVTSAVTSNGSGQATINILPAINDGSLMTVDSEGNTVSLAAYQNVSAAVANDSAITGKGTTGGIYRQNLAFHKNACTFAMIDLELPKSFVSKSRVRDPESGLSLSMCSSADIENMVETTRIDARWGVKLIYPELAFRIWSSKLN